MENFKKLTKMNIEILEILYSLTIFEEEQIFSDDFESVFGLRVPGGWIFKFYEVISKNEDELELDDSIELELISSTFVPYCEEYKKILNKKDDEKSEEKSK